MVSLAKKELAPGESTVLQVVIDTAMKQGEVTKSVTIHSDDPKQPRLRVALLINAVNPHKNMSAEDGAKIFTD
ncbi:hypothetical protein ACSTKJ_00070, partial [Vibrio parahaemolyticus]